MHHCLLLLTCKCRSMIIHKCFLPIGSLCLVLFYSENDGKLIMREYTIGITQLIAFDSYSRLIGCNDKKSLYWCLHDFCSPIGTIYGVYAPMLNGVPILQVTIVIFAYTIVLICFSSKEYTRIPIRDVYGQLHKTMRYCLIPRIYM
jgi:hypothetical protein